MKNFHLDKIYCTAPWTTICIDPEGAVMPCAIFEKEYEFDENDRPLYKTLLESSFEAAFNSSTMKNTRKQIAANIIPRGCEKCEVIQRAWGWPYRYSMKREFFDPNMFDNFDFETGIISKPFIQFIDMALTNRCNLRCRMCSPTFCSGLTKEIFALSERDYHGDNEISLSIPREYLFSANLKLLKLQGGECLLEPETISILKLLIANGMSKTIKLQIITNVTLITKKHLNLFRHFNEVSLLCSIDGWGEVNEYIRYPSKWNHLYKKLKMIHSFCHNHSNIIFEINTVVQLYNIFHLPSFSRKLWDNFNVVPYFQLLQTPSYFNIRLLPPEIKLKLKNIYEQFFAEEKYKVISKGLKPCIQHMLEENCSAQPSDFIHVTRFFDKSRKQNVRNVCPELDCFFDV